MTTVYTITLFGLYKTKMVLQRHFSHNVIPDLISRVLLVLRISTPKTLINIPCINLIAFVDLTRLGHCVIRLTMCVR